MIAPPIPQREMERLRNLRDYHVLDTHPEPELDGLAELAAKICETPIALISFVDEKRQWFKARHGYDVSETPRGISFCAHALSDPDLFVVCDTVEDHRFRDHPSVIGEPGIRFYAGSPLQSSEGHIVGTLCVIDRKPRILTEVQRLALRQLGRQVMHLLDLRRRAREAQSYAMLTEEILESQHATIVVLDIDGVVLRVNEARVRQWREMQQIRAPALHPGTSYLEELEKAAELSDPALVNEIRRGIRAVLDRRESQFQLEYSTILDGRKRWFTLRVSPLDHLPARAVVTRQDVTERKAAEEYLGASLKENLELHAALDEHAIVVTIDARGQITAINDRCCAITKYGRAELLGQDHRIIHSGQCSPKFRRKLRATMGRGKTWHGEMKNRAKDGSCYWVEATIVPFRDENGRIRRYTAICSDITERKLAEEALQSSRLFLAELIEHSGSLVFVKDQAGRYQLVNKKWEEVTHRKREQVLGRTDAELFPEGDGERFRQADLEIMRSGETRVIEEELTDENRTRTFLSVKFPIRGTAGNSTGLCGMATEITERMEANEKVRQQAALLDKAQDAILVRSLDHQITYWNKGAERIYGWTAAEAIGRSVRGMLYDDPKPLLAATDIAIAKGEWVGEIEQHSKTGQRLTIEARWTLVRDEQGNPKSILAINTDITERKKLEQQFLRAQRMESIGTLAGGIAHDLNNVLGPILMSIDVLQVKYPDRKMQEVLAIISASAKRGADMVRQVLSFARGVTGQRLEVQVRHLVRDIEKIVNDTFLKHVQVRTLIPYELWTVIGDATQLHQVLLNLCVNARDAMPDGGTLKVSAENVMLDSTYPGQNGEVQAGPHIVLEVEDSGTGIAPEILEKIFDPFFTTKEVGKGTGLGLSTSIAIVKSHGGFIRVYSEQNKGTKFKVYLPAITTISDTNDTPASIEMPRGNGETILVVDDEASVRQITQQTLEAFGYSVLLACDGAEALALYAKRGGEISVVLTDMMMPVMDGPGVIQVLKKLDPALPIIAASGLSTDAQIARASNLGVKHFLPKPYSAELLLKLLKQLLAAET